MTEADEIADGILAALPAPPRTYNEAEDIAARYVGDQGKTVEANVADALWRMAALKDGNATIPD
jgi:hypothetical protein